MKFQICYCSGASGLQIRASERAETLELAISLAVGEEDNVTAWISEFDPASGRYVTKMGRRAAHQQPEGRGLKSIPARLQFV